MSERDQARPNKLKNRLLGAATLALGGLATAIVVRPDLYYYLTHQADDILKSQQTPVATASVLPTSELPTTTSQTLGHGRGEKPVAFRWNAFGMYTDIIQVTKSIYEEPDGSHALTLTQGMGACGIGRVIIGGHSTPNPAEGAALVASDLLDQLGKKGLGTDIELDLADGTKCVYKTTSYASVKKEGVGPGTFDYYLTHNPMGEDLRNQDSGRGEISFVTCDEASGWNFSERTSNNNLVVNGYLADVIPPKKK